MAWKQEDDKGARAVGVWWRRGGEPSLRRLRAPHHTHAERERDATAIATEKFEVWSDVNKTLPKKNTPRLKEAVVPKSLLLTFFWGRVRKTQGHNTITAFAFTYGVITSAVSNRFLHTRRAPSPRHTHTHTTQSTHAANTHTHTQQTTKHKITLRT